MKEYDKNVITEKFEAIDNAIKNSEPELAERLKGRLEGYLQALVSHQDITADEFLALIDDDRLKVNDRILL